MTGSDPTNSNGPGDATGNAQSEPAFDLERAIASWRRNMRSSRHLAPEELLELESHLRDRIDVLLGQGRAALDAFERARAELGSAPELEPAFRNEHFPDTPSGQTRRLAISLFPPLVISYVQAAARSLKRSATHSAVSILGMGVAMACCIWILVYVRDELGYDAHHEHAERIVRILRANNANTPARWGPALPEASVEIEQAVRVISGQTERALFHVGAEATAEPGGIMVDDGFLDLFAWELALGNPETVLDAPGSIVLSRKLADKYFPDANPVGERIAIAGVTNAADRAEYTVTGVLRNDPRPSHMVFDYLISMETVEAMDRQGTWGTPLSWTNAFVKTYLLLAPGTDRTALAKDLEPYLRRFIPNPQYDLSRIRFESVPSIHLHSEVSGDFAGRGNIHYIWLLTGLAAFVLVIAVVNFVNLATARSIQRSREVGMRKTLGATKRQIVRQYLVESALTVGLAVLAGFFLARWMQPTAQMLTGKDLGLLDRFDGTFLGGVAIIWLATSLAAGTYPAALLSRFEPVTVLRRAVSGGGSRSGIRRVLVVFQFVSAVTLIAVTFIMNKQMDFVDERDLGFDPSHVFVVPIGHSVPVRSASAILVDRLRASTAVEEAAGAHSIPSSFLNSFAYVPEGQTQDERVQLGNLALDFRLLETLDVEILAGRSFDQNLAGDSTTFVLNEAAVRELGWQTPAEAVGRHLDWQMAGLGFSGEVIGVVRDFNFGSLHDEIPPIAFNVSRFGANHLVFRVREGRAAEALDIVREDWNRLEPDHPFVAESLDAMIAAQYADERRLTQLFTWTALLALVISTLGLFALTAYTTERRTREIGIRKALGASTEGLVYAFTRTFLLDVGIAVVIASPLAWIYMDRWLASFAFRTGIGLSPFLLAGLLAAGIAALAVVAQSFRAASAPPVAALRSE